MVLLHRVVRAARVAAIVTAFLLVAREALAHAIVVEESPAPNSIVKGPDVPMKLRFNVRIDAARSKLVLYMPDGSMRELKVKQPSAPDVLAADAEGLPMGIYRLHWLVLAADGHITQGDVLFTVQNP